METNPELPKELVEEIVSKLPGKSLMKFQCVSKLWLSLISSPDLRFMKTHLAMSSKRDDCHSLILTLRPPAKGSDSYLRRCSFSSVLNVATTATTDCVVDVITYPIKSPGKSMVVGSCNGLVCTCFGEKDLFVWNPCTQKYKKLPDISVQIDEDDWYCMNFGFGYDDRNEDYKVVRLFTTLTGGPESPYKTEVEVFSLKKNSWSRIGDINGCSKLIDSGFYASGNLNWAADFDENGWKIRKILRLDLTTETNGEMELPDRNWDELNWGIGVLGGCLSVAYYDDFVGIVWVMKEYGVNDSWTKVCFMTGLDYSGTFRNGPCFPVCAVRDGKVLLVMLGALVLYNPKRNTCRWYRQTSRVEDVSLFVESLVSPDLYLEEPKQL